jgi:hypothetical protein
MFGGSARLWRGELQRMAQANAPMERTEPLTGRLKPAGIIQ